MDCFFFLLSPHILGALVLSISDSPWRGGVVGRVLVAGNDAPAFAPTFDTTACHLSRGLNEEISEVQLSCLPASGLTL